MKPLDSRTSLAHLYSRTPLLHFYSHARLAHLYSRTRLIHLCARLLPALLIFHLAGGLCGTAFAQDLDEVNIGGRVADQNGASVVGAKVTVRHVATGIERSAPVDEEGRYRLIELAPGAYAVRVAAEGFAAEERAGVEMLAGQSVRLGSTRRAPSSAAR
jgi:hypothetical protein